MKTKLISLCLVVGLTSPLFSEMRKWTNTSGTVIEAEFVKAEAGNVTLRLKNGKTSNFSETKLCAADQEFIKTASAAPAEPAAEASPAKTGNVPANRKAKWLSKMDRAKKEAAETGLPIFLLFTGTDWCPYCMHLEDDILSKSEFKEFANQNLVLLKIELAPGSELSSRADEAIAKEYGKGAPRYLVLDPTGKQLAAQTGYNKGTPMEKFIGWVQKAAATVK